MEVSKIVAYKYTLQIVENVLESSTFDSFWSLIKILS
jgi:hypothetical protein